MKQKKSIRCPYCGGTAILRDASFVYGEKSYGGKIPKGTLADQELRKKRMLAHQIFDQIWLRGILSRPDAYHWMADKFCLSDEQAHIGMFGNYMCDQVIRESKKLLAHQRPRLQAAG